ncbi:MAG: FGGY-family carbohydrate kinase, partial [Candidatus Bathyarchaeia archaeon]
QVLRPGWVEQDPEACYWHDFVEISRILLKRSGVKPRDVVGVGVSSLAPDVAPVDRQGKPVRPCIIYMDRRAQAECEWVRKNVGEEKVFQVSGNAIDSYFAGYEVLWLLRNEPENYRRTWKMLNADKYVILKLTGEAVIDHGTAAIFAPFFDYRKKRWSEEMCQLTNVDIDKLPRSYEGHEVIGEVTLEGEKQTGLAKGTPVVAGGPDAMQSAYSVGALLNGDSVFVSGTTGCWVIVQDEPKFDPRFVNTCYLGGSYTSVGAMVTTGALVRWFRDQFGQPEIEKAGKTGLTAYRILDQEAEKIPPGSDGLITIPYFMGERTPIWDPNAKGIIFGLNLYHTKAHIYRSLLESTGYALRQHMEIAKEVGMKINNMVATNGGAKSKLWRQIISDVTGYRQLYVPEARGAPYGDAFLAGVGVGMFKDFSEIKKFVKVEEEVIPDGRFVDRYSKLYEVYQRLYPHTKDDAGMLHSIISKES